jgi:hypothetical protein
MTSRHQTRQLRMARTRPKVLYASQIGAILAGARSFLNKSSYPSQPGRTILLPCYNINLQVNGNLASEGIVANVRKTLDNIETLLQDTFATRY